MEQCRSCLGRCLPEGLAVPLLGTPRAILRLHLLYVAEAVIALACMNVYLMLLTVLGSSRLTVNDLVLMLALILVPIFLTAIRLPMLVRMHHYCASAVSTYEAGERGVSELTQQLLSCRRSQDQRRFSMLLGCWYLLGILWTHQRDPCVAATDSGLIQVTCGAFEASCAALFAANMLLVSVAALAPGVVARHPSNFTPQRCQGIPKDLLARLHTFEYQRSAEDGGEKTECVVCFDDFEEGQTLRRLPCGHTFHAQCIDGWLGSKPACPMRCAADLWATLADPATTPGSPCPNCPAEGHGAPAALLNPGAAAECPRDENPGNAELTIAAGEPGVPADGTAPPLSPETPGAWSIPPASTFGRTTL